MVSLRLWVLLRGWITSEQLWCRRLWRGDGCACQGLADDPRVNPDRKGASNPTTTTPAHCPSLLDSLHLPLTPGQAGMAVGTRGQGRDSVKGKRCLRAAPGGPKVPALWFYPQLLDTALLVKKPRKLSWENELLKVGVSQGGGDRLGDQDKGQGLCFIELWAVLLKYFRIPAEASSPAFFLTPGPDSP